MNTTGRIAKEYIAQAFSFGVTLLDRIVLAGLLIRVLGVEGFAAWSVALSAAGMVLFFEFGLSLYFSNRITFAVEQGRQPLARRVFAAGNLLLIGTALLGSICIMVGYAMWYGADETLGSRDLVMATGLLILGTAIRQAMSACYSLYRAHLKFARQTILLSAGDLFKILLAIAGAVIDGSILAAAFGYFAGSLISFAVIFVLDARRRFPDFPFRLQWPTKREWRRMLPISGSYWLQTGSITILTFAPVFFLASAAGAIATAQFVLIRTLGNFGRQTLQLFAIVLGQEAARRIAAKDSDGFTQVFEESGRLLAVQSAGACGLLLSLGRPIFEIWTGESQLYDIEMLAMTLLPLMFAPTLMLAHILYNASNQPHPMAIGRVMQIVLTAAVLFFYDGSEWVLWTLIALAIGEILGFGTVIIIALSRASSAGRVLKGTARSIVFALVSFTLVYFIGARIGSLFDSPIAILIMGGGAPSWQRSDAFWSSVSRVLGARLCLKWAIRVSVRA